MIHNETSKSKSNLITLAIITLRNCRKPVVAGSDFFRIGQ